MPAPLLWTRERIAAAIAAYVAREGDWPSTAAFGTPGNGLPTYPVVSRRCPDLLHKPKNETPPAGATGAHTRRHSMRWCERHQRAWVPAHYVSVDGQRLLAPAVWEPLNPWLIVYARAWATAFGCAAQIHIVETACDICRKGADHATA